MKYETSKSAQLILDYLSGSYKAYSQANPEKFNEAIRAKFMELMPTPNAMGRYKYRELLTALPKAFTLLEEVLDVTLNDAWPSSSFYNELVDVRNLALGDKNDFIIDDNSWVTVNRFSGNHWDTDREKLTGRRKISVDTEWFDVHVYDDYERFLNGTVTMDALIQKVTGGFVRQADTLVAVAFNSAASNLPPGSGLNVTAPLARKDFQELLLKVKTAAQKNVRIMGTEIAIAQLNDIQEVRYSDAMRNELYSTGRLGKWMGYNVVEIPQAFAYGTYDWAVDNDSLLIVPETEKFIKFVDEGETRSRELEYRDHIHLMLNAPINTNILALLSQLKGVVCYEPWRDPSAAGQLRKRLWGKHTFFSNGVFVCTCGDASQETIRRYIESQG